MINIIDYTSTGCSKMPPSEKKTMQFKVQSGKGEKKVYTSFLYEMRLESKR